MASSASNGDPVPMAKHRITRDELMDIADPDAVITVEALRTRGITRRIQGRLVREGILQPFTSSLLGLTPPTWDARLAAALRLGGEEAAAYGPTALALHGLGERKLPIQIVVPPGSHPRDRNWVRFHRKDLGGRKLLTNLAPRRIALDDSVIDALAHLDEIAAIALLTRVTQERRTTAGRLLEIVNRRRRVAHREVVTRILRDGAGLESALEYTYAVRVERPHGLEPMVRQYVVPETGHRADGAYPARRQLVHLDGARYHDADADRDLDNRHASLGYGSFRFTWSDCWSTPCRTASRVAGGEPPTRCPAC